MPGLGVQSDEVSLMSSRHAASCAESQKDTVGAYGATATECEPTLGPREVTVHAIMHRLQEAKQLGRDRTTRLVPLTTIY
jgi:hypothetical protein